jgi:hypothetical protein
MRPGETQFGSNARILLSPDVDGADNYPKVVNAINITAFNASSNRVV